MHALGGILTVFGLGMVYLVAAIPAGLAFHQHIAVSASIAWAGYVCIALVMLLAGEPVRAWLVRRFKLSPNPDPAKFFWRIWLRWGMVGLGLIAPVTVGPYVAAIIGVSLGEKPGRVMFWVAAGVIPWLLAFAAMAGTGSKLMGH